MGPRPVETKVWEVIPANRHLLLLPLSLLSLHVFHSSGVIEGQSCSGSLDRDPVTSCTDRCTPSAIAPLSCSPSARYGSVQLSASLIYALFTTNNFMFMHGSRQLPCPRRHKCLPFASKKACTARRGCWPVRASSTDAAARYAHFLLLKAKRIACIAQSIMFLLCLQLIITISTASPVRPQPAVCQTSPPCCSLLHCCKRAQMPYRRQPLLLQPCFVL